MDTFLYNKNEVIEISKKIFTEGNIQDLKRNPNVRQVSEKTITYADDFKRKFIDEYLTGKLPRVIFEEAGFDIDMISIKQAEQSAYRWLKAYNKDGIVGLCDARGGASERPLVRELTQTDITYMPFGNSKIACLSTIKMSYLHIIYLSELR